MQDHEQTPRQLEYAVQLFERVCEYFVHTRRRAATAGVGLLAIWLAFHVIFGANGMVVYQNKRAEYDKVQKDLATEEEENQRLTKQVERLRNDPKAIEREAREQLHYTKKGEVIYLLPNQKPADESAPNSAAKLGR